MAKETDPLVPPALVDDEENQPVHAQHRRSSSVRTPFPISMTSALWAEFLGTFIFVQIGCGVNCATLFLNDDSSAIGWKPSALGWGLALMLAVYISAPISGGHVNPAVSLSFALVRRGKFSFGKVLPYWIAQLLGAMVGTMSNLFLFHQTIRNYEAGHGIIRGSVESLQSANAFADYFNV
jgi:glycerol uptake facilitator protein